MSFQIGAHQIAGRAVLAPLSGISDLPFRQRAQAGGAAYVISEMVACEALAHGQPEAQMRSELPAHGLKVVQLAGREPKWLAEGARRVVAAGADVIDINMGCPARRVTGGYSGSALMKDLDRAVQMVAATVAAVPVPVTLKMRLGWDPDTINAPELAARAAQAGVQLITVHGRTRSQFFKGQADWRAVKAVVDAVDIPVIVNGDITDAQSARTALDHSGAAAVMIGRGAYGQPWKVGQIAAAIEGRPVQSAPQGSALCDYVSDHYEAILSFYGTRIGTRIARKHLSWYGQTCVPNQSPEQLGLLQRMLRAEAPDTVLDLLRRLLTDVPSHPSARRAA